MTQNQEEILLRGRLDGKQRNHLRGLLDMEYSPKELADELKITIDQIYRVYIPGGCPHERTERNHILINGKAFRAWFELTYKKRSLEPGFAFCLTCKKAVEMISPERMKQDRLIYDLCKCPNCGRALTKIIDHKRRISA